MAVIPYSRVVDVTVTRADNFVSRRGFGTALFLQSTEVSGEVDATSLTKLYTTPEEVAADFAADSEAYKAAQVAFSQNPRPVAFKIGYYDDTDIDATKLTAALNAVREQDPNWYFLTVESDLRDIYLLNKAIADWAEARTVYAIIDSNDSETEKPADTTSVAAQLKETGYDRTMIFYHTTASEYPSVALAAVVGSFVLDDDESAYTPAFKRLRSTTRSNIASAALQAVTGFVPQLGQDKTQGHLASVYVDIGGQSHVQFGSSLNPNVFLDEVHFGDWLKARTEEEMFNILLKNKRVSFDDRGMALLASGIELVMNRAIAAGAVASDIDDETGLLSPAYTMIIPRATSVPASQRNARISPPIRIQFRYAGAVHYGQSDYIIES